MRYAALSIVSMLIGCMSGDAEIRQTRRQTEHRRDAEKRWNAEVGELPNEEELAAKANAPYWTARGISRRSRGDFEGAERLFKKAIELRPSSFGPRFHLAILFVMQNKFAEARPQVLRARQDLLDEQEDLRSRALLGYCDLKLGNDLAAGVHASEVLKRDARSPIARNVRGLLHRRRGKLEDAADDFQYAFREATVRHEAVENFAEIKMTLGEYDAAWPAVKTLLDDTSADPRVELLAARVRLSQEDWRQAALHARRAARLEPSLLEAQEILNTACRHGTWKDCKD